MSMHGTAKRLRTLADLPGPKGLPLVGNVLQIESMRFHQTMEKWAREFGPLYKFSIGRRRLVVTSDNDVIATLLRDRPDTMRRSSRASRMFEEGGILGLFIAEGEEWRSQRKLAMRALTPEVVHNFFPTLVDMTERLRRRWHGALAAGESLNMLRDLKAYTLDVTLALAMGEDINTLEHEDNPLQRDIEFIFNRIARRLTFAFPYWRLLRLPVDRANDASAARIREAIAGFIARARRRLADNPALRMKPSNMLEALVVARDEPESGFTDAHVIGNAIGIVFAGEDTTSNSIAWLLNFLAHHPQAAANLADEADRVLGNAKVLQDFHQLEQFPYLEAANKESMRLKPVAPALALETNKDVVIADALVPAGTIVVGLLRYSAECDLGLGQEFQPERWLSQQHSTDSDPARKFFPFGGGPRFCPGRYLALAEIKMVMSMLARNFKLQPIKDVPPVEENFTFTMTPSALPVLLRVRTDTWHVAGLGQSLEDYPQIRE